MKTKATYHNDMKNFCVVCQEEITQKENQWGFRIRSYVWIHYRCLEHLWEVYISMSKEVNNDQTA